MHKLVCRCQWLKGNKQGFGYDMSRGDSSLGGWRVIGSDPEPMSTGNSPISSHLPRNPESKIYAPAGHSQASVPAELFRLWIISLPSIQSLTISHCNIELERALARHNSQNSHWARLLWNRRWTLVEFGNKKGMWGYMIQRTVNVSDVSFLLIKYFG